VHDRHFGYITKSFNETPGHTVEKEMQQQVYYCTTGHLGSMANLTFSKLKCCMQTDQPMRQWGISFIIEREIAQITS
jgi:hypothetical protein